MTCYGLVHPKLSYEPLIPFAAGNSEGWCRFSCMPYILYREPNQRRVYLHYKNHRKADWKGSLEISKSSFSGIITNMRSDQPQFFWVLEVSRKRDPTIWYALQLASWNKACQKSLGMLSFWHSIWTKFTTGTLILAKSPPSCNFPVTFQFKSKISLDNPCWWYQEKSI